MLVLRAPVVVQIYFFGAWTYWRYHILYISERAFESGGRVWDNVFVYVCVCLFIMELFTGAPRPLSCNGELCKLHAQSRQPCGSIRVGSRSSLGYVPADIGALWMCAAAT